MPERRAAPGRGAELGSRPVLHRLRAGCGRRRLDRRHGRHHRRHEAADRAAFGGRARRTRASTTAMNKGLALARGEFVVLWAQTTTPCRRARRGGACDRRGARAHIVAVPRVARPARRLGTSAPPSECGADARARAGAAQSIFVRTRVLRAVGGFDRAIPSLRTTTSTSACATPAPPGAGRRDALEFRLGGASSVSAWATARDYRDVRVAHGANPLVESIVVRKSALGAWLHASMMRLRSVSGDTPSAPALRRARLPAIAIRESSSCRSADEAASPSTATS